MDCIQETRDKYGNVSALSHTHTWIASAAIHGAKVHDNALSHTHTWIASYNKNYYPGDTIALSHTHTWIASAKCNKVGCVYGFYVYNLYLIECIRQNETFLAPY